MMMQQPNSDVLLTKLQPYQYHYSFCKCFRYMRNSDSLAIVETAENQRPADSYGDNDILWITYDYFDTDGIL